MNRFKHQSLKAVFAYSLTGVFTLQAAILIIQFSVVLGLVLVVSALFCFYLSIAVALDMMNIMSVERFFQVTGETLDYIEEKVYSFLRREVA